MKKKIALWTATLSAITGGLLWWTKRSDRSSATSQ